jgi:quercetin dioxygenase-like cupin family protein
MATGRRFWTGWAAQTAPDVPRTGIEPAAARLKIQLQGNGAQMTKPVSVNANDVAEAAWDDPARGTIRWKTLLSGDVTATDTLVCGVAIMDAGDTFALHSHPEPEVYFGLEGAVTVQIDGTAHRLSPGVALFIPGHAVHGVLRADQPVRWFYSFAADAFADIAYTFADTSSQSPEAQP